MQKIYKAKKSLGQNFLKSESALREIIQAGEIQADDTVLEIGPGKGVLTARLLAHAGQVIAIEKDQELFGLLQEKFKNEIEKKKLILLEKDILEFNVAEVNIHNVRFMEQQFSSDPRKQSPDHSKNSAPFHYKIIANIPYNITGAILKKFLTEAHQPELMVLMVQHEVAKRIVARDSKESILSISVKAYGEPKTIAKVPARYFSPAPKVDSAIIKIAGISRKVFTEHSIEEFKFWEIIHAGFAHKRKVLVSNLKNFDPKKDWLELFKQLEINNQVRAEDLSLFDWISILKKL